MIDINDLIKNSDKNQECAMRVADLYLEKNPRELYYGADLVSTEDDSEMTYYHSHTDEELEILRKCMAIAKEEDYTLDEILATEGYTELLEKLVTNHSLLPLDLVKSVDLDNPLKYTQFSFQNFQVDGSVRPKRHIDVPLTDEEYKTILAEMLLNSNRYSMNMLVYHKPEIAKAIMAHISYSSCDCIMENYEPFVVDMCEFREVCEKILNPFKDELNLFNSEDKELKEFAHWRQIVPDSGDLFFCPEAKDGADPEVHVYMHFDGSMVKVHQDTTSDTNGTYDSVSFEADAEVVMNRYGLKTPEEILPYLQEYCTTRDCYYILRNEILEGRQSAVC